MTKNTNTTKFTPGPWTVHNNIGRKGEIGVVADAAPCIIAVMGNSKEWPALAAANAHLIAASPALYEALQRAVDHAEKGDDYDWIGAAIAALRHARGE